MPTLDGGGGLRAHQPRRPKPRPNARPKKKARRSNESRTSNEREGDPDDPDDSTVRNRADWYRITVLVCSALNTLHSHSISIAQTTGAVDDLAGAARAILANGGRLSINWHIAMHYVDTVKRFGPLSGYSTWVFERNNGKLSRVKNNGLEKDLPVTLARSWLLEMGLTAVVNSPAPDADELERAFLRELTTNKAATQGTLMLEEARGIATAHMIRLPEPYQKGILVDLNHYRCYVELLEFVTTRFPQLGLRDDAFWEDVDSPCLPRRSSAYTVYTHAIYNGFKFCSTLWSRSRRDRFALAVSDEGTGARDLCKIHLMLRVNLAIEGAGGHRQRLDQTLALVEFYQGATGTYPWQSRDVDLGIKIYRDQTRCKRFIPLENLQASTIICRISTHQDGDCIVSVSCDREGPEPDDWLNEDLEDMPEPQLPVLVDMD